MYPPETMLLVTIIAAVFIVGIRCVGALCNRLPTEVPTEVPVVAPLRPTAPLQTPMPLQTPTPPGDESPPSYKEAVGCNV